MFGVAGLRGVQGAGGFNQGLGRSTRQFFVLGASFCLNTGFRVLFRI